MAIYVIHDGIKDINLVVSDSKETIEIPVGCFCEVNVKPGERQTIVFVDGARTVKSDYRNITFYDEAIKEKKYISEIGDEPYPSWVEWKSCFNCWIETVIKPKRSEILKEWDEYEFRCYREEFLAQPLTYTLQQIMDYKDAVHMFPDGLTEIVEDLKWPTSPE